MKAGRFVGNVLTRIKMCKKIEREKKHNKFQVSTMFGNHNLLEFIDSSWIIVLLEADGVNMPHPQILT